MVKSREPPSNIGVHRRQPEPVAVLSAFRKHGGLTRNLSLLPASLAPHSPATCTRLGASMSQRADAGRLSPRPNHLEDNVSGIHATSFTAR